MPTLLALSRRIDAISKAAGWVAEWLVLAACLVSAANATVRYLFSYSSNGWLEIQWYMFGALVFLGASQTLRANEHVRVDLFYSWVSDRTRLWIDALGFILFFIPVTVFLTWLTVPFFVRSFELGEYSNNAGGLILWPIKLILPLGFALLTLQGVSELVKRLAALHGDLRLETHYEKPLQ
ncbi:MAG TPA: TRAP transporter small permease subunit [Beijerinckiaceae bacterium]|jgi:TRAP-type mannitol/chloroaromatic compound transport system permease small subunit